MTHTAAQVKELVQGNTRFALDLYHSLRKASSGDLFFSPVSVSLCLGMVLLGARGRTASQMVRCLHIGAEHRNAQEELAALQAMLLADGEKATSEVRIANKLWADRNILVLQEFLDRVNRSFRGSFQDVDFSNSGEACRLINDWVKQSTNDLIREIVTEDLIRDALLVLANAIYFHGKWATPFQKENTRRRPFYLASGTTVQVPMMAQFAAAQYAEVPGLRLLEKSYGEGQFSMVILLPERYDGLDALEAEMNAEYLDALLARLESKDEIDITLPKFSIASDYALEETLIALGMTDAFDLQVADFSGLSGRKDLALQQVIHKAVIDVDEEGTEAAAVTLTAFFSGLPDFTRTAVFHADRPFLFLIRHIRSRTILFLGRVMDPRKA